MHQGLNMDYKVVYKNGEIVKDSQEYHRIVTQILILNQAFTQKEGEKYAVVIYSSPSLYTVDWLFRTIHNFHASYAKLISCFSYTSDAN